MPKNQSARGSAPRSDLPDAEEVHLVLAMLIALRRIRFGSVALVVQDGRVVQIETTEKRRLIR